MGRLNQWGDEIEPDDEDLPPAHDPRCRNGWLGYDAEERPRICLVCRPHLARKTPRRHQETP